MAVRQQPLVMRDWRTLAAGLMATVATAATALGGSVQAGAEPAQGLEALDQACLVARQRGDLQALRSIQRKLLMVSPAPQPLAVVLANADALLRCGAPDAALTVLNRFSPAPGAESVQWLLLQWRAANGALDHRLAAESVRRLVVATGQSLEQLQLPLAPQPNGRWQTQAALDLLAGHLEAMGQPDQAALVLSGSRSPGVVSAQRLSQAARLATTTPLAERLRWLDLALEQAAASSAWGLAMSLLDQQLLLLADQPAEQRRQVEQRRLRLAQRLDDAATLNPAAVRSPRAPGGHAAVSQP
jgi:hypothetical protein